MFNLVQEWNLADSIKFMSVDAQLPTLVSMLELVSCWKRRWTRSPVPYILACRNHIMELIVAKVFDTLMGPFIGPDIKLFQRFGECWSSIDRSSCENRLIVCIGTW